MRLEEITTIGYGFEPAPQNDWIDESVTTVDEPFLLCVRKMDAPPADELEEIESAREQLHATVDRIIDRAKNGIDDLAAQLASAQRENQSLAAELDVVVRYANALAMSTAPARRRDDTEPDLPAARRHDRDRQATMSHRGWTRAGVLHVA